MGNIKRVILNIGLFGIFAALFDASIVYGGLSSRYTHVGMDNGSIPEPLFILIPSLIVTAVCSGAFRGYKREFLDVYRKPVTVTVIVQAAEWALSLLWMIRCKSAGYGGFMPGFSALGDYVMMWMIWAVTVLALAVMWAVTLARRYRNN
ncbi:MAG: hypothetical protein IJ080_04615 [Oscillospiraceae bacterium]|nr:hypothetical protein [Oscillospiraceae bacterium]MBQ8979031.1 hypothetical protein [Oscillospiraceae bacterium]